MTLEVCAQYIKVGESTLRRWARQSQIPSYKFGKRIRFERSEIDKWFKQFKRDAVYAEQLATQLYRRKSTWLAENQDPKPNVGT